MLRKGPLLPELAQEARSLTHRVSLANELGAWALGIDGDIYGDPVIRKTYATRLHAEQPDLFYDISMLEGALYSILIDGCRSSRKS